MKKSQSKLIPIPSMMLISALLIGAASPQMAQANDIERLVSGLCDAAKADDRSGMRKKLKSAKIRLKNIYHGVKCDGDGSLLRAATSAGALNAATFIATKIGKSNLASTESDGKTIVEYTESLVASGDQSKQAFVELFKSKM